MDSHVMNMPKLIAVLALMADCLTYFSIGQPIVGACWALAAIVVTVAVPAR
jgi:hypothetical protein